MTRGLALLLGACALAWAACASAAGSGPNAAAGFSMLRIATVESARELAFAPNGDLLVGTGGSDVYVVPNADGTRGAGRPRVFAHFGDPPAAGVALAGDTIYIGTQFAVWRIPYRPGDLRARSAPEKLVSVRTSGVARDHVTTSVAVAKGTLYASVGSSCNSCWPDLDQTRATVGRITAGHYQVVAHNIRNAIALTANENTGSLWAGDAGQDELPFGHPYEIFDDISAHVQPMDYGWPFCYENHKPNPSPEWRGHSCKDVVIQRVALPAYATPIGAVFYPQNARGRYAFPTRFDGGAFVTLHGSWHTTSGGGFAAAPGVLFIPMHGDSPAIGVDWNNPEKQWIQFVGGYQVDGTQQRTGRPTGIAVGPQGDLFVADDDTGAIYRIRPK